VFTEQVEIGQILVDEVPLMGMLPVDITEIAQEFSALDLEPVGQEAGLEIAFFQIHPTVAVDGQIGGGVEIRIDGGGEGDFRLAKVEAVLGPGVIMRRVRFRPVDMKLPPGHEGLTDDARPPTVDVVLVIVAIEDDRQARVEVSR
jgi:hypothetical protein